MVLNLDLVDAASRFRLFLLGITLNHAVFFSVHDVRRHMMQISTDDINFYS